MPFKKPVRNRYIHYKMPEGYFKKYSGLIYIGLKIERGEIKVESLRSKVYL